MTEQVDRLASRVLLLDSAGRLLLFRGCDPADPAAGSWWFTPGGGRDLGESATECAARELHEETGLLLSPDAFGEVVHERLTVFGFDGVTYRQQEDYFLVQVDAHEVDTTRFTALELASVSEHRWWSVDQLKAAEDRIYPEELLDLLDGVA